MALLARPFRALLPVLSLLALVAGCGDDAHTVTPAPTPDVPNYEAAGPSPVGNATVTLDDAARGRTLRVEIWYPAAESARAAAAKGAPVAEFAPEGAERDQLAALVAAAPDPGTSRRTGSARDAAPAATGSWPVVAFSHCYNGTRYSTFSIAERLASHGIAVVAPDHTGGTLTDELAGTAAALDTDFLGVRAGDIAFTLDRVLDAGATELPAALRGRFDAKRVGVFGHSFGGVTTGLVLMNDTRPRAGLALAVPMENPLLPGVTMTALHVPLFFLLATEDNSIGAIGNLVLNQNFADANPPIWKIDVRDAGHWSVSNICGLAGGFQAGCVPGTRQTDGTPFTYLDIEEARGVAQAYTTAFFAATLDGDATGHAYLDGAHPKDVVTATHRQ
jgi:dienelactone hydrolase